jgi:hypothetical protein
MDRRGEVLRQERSVNATWLVRYAAGDFLLVSGDVGQRNAETAAPVARTGVNL